MIIIIIKTIVGWILLIIAGTSLLGLIVRGIFQPFQPIGIDEPLLNRYISKQKRVGILLTVFFSLTGVFYFYLLYHYVNIGVVIAQLMIMIARLPDLILEIRTGKKMKFGTKLKGPINYLVTLLLLASLPVLWYSFYIQK